MKSPSWISIIVLALLAKPAIAGFYNPSSDSKNVVCVYPISGQYETLNRVLFYLLWVFAFVASLRGWQWFTIGSLAYIMAYSATSAVHALVLAISSSNSLYDLDVPGTWAILSVSIFAAIPIAYQSNSLRNSMYRPIFSFWGTLVTIGGICCIFAFGRKYPEEPGCYSSDGSLLTNQQQLLIPDQFSCTYSCFSTHQATRNPGDITVISPRRAFGSFFVIAIVSVVLTAVLGIVFGIFSCCTAGIRQPTRAELQKIVAKGPPEKPKNSRPRGNNRDFNARKYTQVPKHRRAANNAARRRRQEEERKYNQAKLKYNKALKDLETGEYNPGSIVCLKYYPLAMPIVMAFNEIYILGAPALPQNENMYAVGQWAPWVTVGLALVAASINARYEPKWNAILKAYEEDRVSLLQQKQQKTKPPELKLDLESQPGGQDAWVTQTLGFAMNKLNPPEEPRRREAALAVPVSCEASSSSSTLVPPSTAQIAAPTEAEDNLPAIIPTYGPPFPIAGFDYMPVIHHDKACRMYDQWDRKDDGKLVRDINGKEWVVHKGVLFHKELWVKPNSTGNDESAEHNEEDGNRRS